MKTPSNFQESVSDFRTRLIELFDEDIAELRKVVEHAHITPTIHVDPQGGVIARFRNGRKILDLKVDSESRKPYTWSARELDEEVFFGNANLCPFPLLEQWLVAPRGINVKENELAVTGD